MIHKLLFFVGLVVSVLSAVLIDISFGVVFFIGFFFLHMAL